MTTGKPIDKSTDKVERRHPGITRHIGAVLPAVTRPAFRAAGALAAQLMADWPIIVGPALAAVSTPRRFTAGTLTLGCSGPVAMELQHLATQLVERVNLHLGRPAVQRLRLVQEAPRPKPAIAARPAHAAPPSPPKPIEGLPDGPLRDALTRLAARIAR